jgi:hypothetical protein
MFEPWGEAIPYLFRKEYRERSAEFDRERRQVAGPEQRILIGKRFKRDLALLEDRLQAARTRVN